MQVSAQSWEGLADSDDERHRIAATAEGGIWLLRTPRPDAVVALAGTQPLVDTTRRFDGAGAWSDDGLSRTRLAPVLDGDLVRRLDVGQVAYIYRGGVTFLQVKRLTGRQPAIGHGADAVTMPLPVVAAVPGMWTGSGVGAEASAGAGVTAGAANVPISGPVAGPPWDSAPLVASGVPGSGWPGMPVPATLGRKADGWTAAGRTALPDVSEVLDEAFGARHD